MINNSETRKALEKIKGFICDGIEYKKTQVVGNSVVKAIITSDCGKSAMVRWEFGRGWIEAGTGRGGDRSKHYYPIIGRS
jgi:hypothetical protein